MTRTLTYGNGFDTKSVGPRLKGNRHEKSQLTRFIFLYCPSGTFVQNNTCEPCIPDCQVCTDQSTCLSCAFNHQLQNETRACKKCETDQFFNTTSRQCNQCGPNCGLCNSSASCYACFNGFKVNRGVCQIDCSLGQNKNQTECILESQSQASIVNTTQTQNITDSKASEQANSTAVQPPVINSTVVILILASFLVIIVLLVALIACLVIYMIKSRQTVDQQANQIHPSNQVTHEGIQSMQKPQINASVDQTNADQGEYQLTQRALTTQKSESPSRKNLQSYVTSKVGFRKPARLKQSANSNLSTIEPSSNQPLSTLKGFEYNSTD